jgi:hypothetical protein
MQAAGLFATASTSVDGDSGVTPAGARRLRKRGVKEEPVVPGATGGSSARRRTVPPEMVLHYKLGSRRKEKLIDTLLGRYVPDSSSDDSVDEDYFNDTIRWVASRTLTH